MAITVTEAAKRLRSYDKLKDAAVLGALDRAGVMALRLSVTKYMKGLGQGKNAQPPNPPPGPIGIRKGDLRRAVYALKSTRVAEGFMGGIAVDLDRCRYGRIHELSGTAGRGSFIPARPYMRPAVEEITPEAVKLIDVALERLLQKLLP